MTKEQIEIEDVRQELNKLMIQVKNAEKWVEYSKQTINELREKMLNFEEKMTQI